MFGELKLPRPLLSDQVAPLGTVVKVICVPAEGVAVPSPASCAVMRTTMG